MNRADVKLTSQFKSLDSLNITAQLLTLYILTGKCVHSNCYRKTSPGLFKNKTSLKKNVKTSAHC